MLYYIPVKKKLKNIVTLAFVGIFMALIGFTPSVIRAGALVISVLISRTLLTETDNYTVLAVIIIITLIINPYSANNGSLLLSYSAYFGVIYAADLCNTKGINKILTVFMLSVFAVLYTCPALAVLDMGTTYLAPVFNFILSPVIMAVCVLSFFRPVISYIPFIGVIASVIAPVNNILIMFLIRFTEFAEEYFSFAYIEFTDESIKVMIFAVVIAVSMAFIQFEDNKNRIILSVAISMGIVLCYNYLNSNTATIKVFDGSSEPSYIVIYRDKNYLVATENINDKRLTEVTQQLGIDKYDEIICCMKTEADDEMYTIFSDKVTIISQSGVYESDIIEIDTQVNNRRMSYLIHIGELDIGFSHNKADLSEKDIDLYFFGSDIPGDFKATESYYFYPANKKQTEIIKEKHAAELYDVLTIKAKLPDGSYRIVKDVKNFGNQLQNNR